MVEDLEVEMRPSEIPFEEAERRLFLAMSKLVSYEDLNNNLKNYEKNNRTQKS